MKLNFQFREKVSTRTRTRISQQLREAGARDVHSLFPDESDPELGALYVADVPAEQSEKLLQWLRDRREIAFAEQQVQRQLLR